MRKLKAVFFENTDGEVCGFEVAGHGDSIVCAAVSMLCINTVNSLETLTDCELTYEYEPDGGHIYCHVPQLSSGPRLLLASLRLGLTQVKDVYGLDLTTKIITE